jgi:hypothetical protein
LACFFLDTRKIFLKGQNSKKVVMSSSPRKGDACSSETKHNRRMAPRPKMFVSRRRLQRGHNLKKTILSSSPGEDDFCSSKNKHDKGTLPRPMTGLQ